VKKATEGKLRHDLLPFAGLDAVTRVLMFGSAKYSDFGWRKNFEPATDDLLEGSERGTRVFLAAALRHLFARLRGETCDPESGEDHLAHVACCCLFILDNIARRA